MLKRLLFFIFLLSFLMGQEKLPDMPVKLLSGKTANLYELLESGPVIIDFWATWCVPCKKVMKFLNQYHLDYAKENFKVLMINTDSPRSLGKVKTYVRSQGFSFNVGMDPNKVISKKLNGMVMPTLILVDKGGRVKWMHQGYVAGEEVEIEKQIRQILGKNIDDKINK